MQSILTADEGLLALIVNPNRMRSEGIRAVFLGVFVRHASVVEVEAVIVVQHPAAVACVR